MEAGNFGHFTAYRTRQEVDNLIAGEVRISEEIGQLGQGGLDSQVKAEDDAGAAQVGARGVDRRNEAGDALADINDDDAALNGIANDLGEAAVGAAGDVAHAKGLENEATQVRQAEDGVEHLWLDTGEHAETGDMGGVESWGDAKLGNAGGAMDVAPVHVDAEAVDPGQGIAVGRVEGFEGGRRDLCGAVAAIELVVEEESDLGDDESAGDDEGAEEVVDSIGLESEDGSLGSGEDDGLAEVLHDEG